MNALAVRPIAAADYDQWRRLFEEYREFCGRDSNPSVIAQVWDWLMDPEHAIRGIVAVSGDDVSGHQVAGIAHFRSFSRTVDANEGLHLDDLYIAEPFRGNGTARDLLDEIGDIASFEDAEFVRWVTAADNESAQRLYDGIAKRTDWVTYEQSPNQ